MKIVTWNLGYWQHGKYHDEAWDYLCNELKPDLALLQEVKPPSWVSQNALLFEEITRGWGTAIYAPALSMSNVAFPIHQERWTPILGQVRGVSKVEPVCRFMSGCPCPGNCVRQGSVLKS